MTKPPEESLTDVLERIRPVLEVIFPALRLTEQQARQVIEEACFPMAHKRWWQHPEPELWLTARILDRCWRARKEEADEDPPE